MTDESTGPGRRADESAAREPEASSDVHTPPAEPAPPAGETRGRRAGAVRTPRTGGQRILHAMREFVIIVVIALVASALLRAFVVQAFYVPSGSMLPEIQLQDRIMVSRIGEVERGEVVVFEDPGGWIPSAERPEPPTGVRKGLEWVGVLPASGHEHLVKRVIGLPGDRVVCCNSDGRLTINGYAVDETEFLAQTGQGADDISFDVTVPEDRIFVLGDNRYVSGDSSRHLTGQDAFIPLDLVTGRAFAVIWPADHAHVLRIPDAYDDVPEGKKPPEKGVIRAARPGLP